MLLRGLTPVAGLDEMRAARPTARRDRDLCAGPARLCLALGIDRAFDGADLVTGDRGVRGGRRRRAAARPCPRPSGRVGPEGGDRPAVAVLRARRRRASPVPADGRAAATSGEPAAERSGRYGGRWRILPLVRPSPATGKAAAMRRRLQLAMVVLSLTMFVGACGGGDDDDEPTTTPPPRPRRPRRPDGHDGQRPAPAARGVRAHPRLHLRRAARVGARRTCRTSSRPIPTPRRRSRPPTAARSPATASGVGVVIAVGFDERSAALPGVEEGFVDGATEDAVDARRSSPSPARRPPSAPTPTAPSPSPGSRAPWPW